MGLERDVEALRVRLRGLPSRDGDCIDDVAASLLTLAPVIVLVLSKELKVVYANSSFEELTGYLHDVSERVAAIEAVQEREKRIASELAQKEILLQELHHRVKNNLQVVSSMLSLQASSCADSRVVRLFRDSQTRVGAMSLVHRVLHESGDVSRLSFLRYLNELTSALRAAYSQPAQQIVVEVDVGDTLVDLEHATPCGLIAGELITNALKHAFVGRAAGTVRIQMSQGPASRVTLTISDDGVGLPLGDAARPSGLGLQLVHALTRQLDGKLTVHTSPGTTFAITFEETLSDSG